MVLWCRHQSAKRDPALPVTNAPSWLQLQHIRLPMDARVRRRIPGASAYQHGEEHCAGPSPLPAPLSPTLTPPAFPRPPLSSHTCPGYLISQLRDTGEAALTERWARVLPPDSDVDIVLTHGPPYGIADKARGTSRGDIGLLRAVQVGRVGPR